MDYEQMYLAEKQKYSEMVGGMRFFRKKTPPKSYNTTDLTEKNKTNLKNVITQLDTDIKEYEFSKGDRKDKKRLNKEKTLKGRQSTLEKDLTILTNSKTMSKHEKDIKKLNSGIDAIKKKIEADTATKKKMETKLKSVEQQLKIQNDFKKFLENKDLYENIIIMKAF